MTEERVVLTAELKDQMSAPLSNAVRGVEGFTKTVQRESAKQSAAVDQSTKQIDGALGRQNRLFSGMAGPIGRATDGAARMFSGMRSRISASLDGLAAQAKGKGEEVANGFGSGLKKAGALVATYFGAQMIGGFIRDAAAASDATDKFKSTMSFAGLDTSAITKAKDEAKAYADATVYDLPTIQNMIAQLASNGVKDYVGLSKAAGNLNAVAGGNAETFKSVAMTMTQTAGAGKLTTENWNQLSDAIPGAAGPLMKALEQAGAYTGNFRDAMEKGMITSDEFNDALMKLGTDPIAVEAAKSTATFEGAIGNLNATINSGLMWALDLIKPAATKAATALSNSLGKGIERVQEAITLLTTGGTNIDIGKALGLSGPALAIFDEGLGSIRAFVGAFKDGATDITSSGFAGVMEGLGGVLGRVAGGFTITRDEVNRIGGDIDPVVKAAFDLKNGFGDVITKLWEFREPITIVGGLIFALLIPGMVKAGTEALKSAILQKLSWAISEKSAVRAVIANSIAFWTIIAGWVLMGAQAMIQAVKIAASWLVAMGPVGWIIGLVALLIAAFVWAYNNIGWFRDGVDAAMRWIGDVVKNVVDWIVGAWNNAVDWFNSTLMPAIQAVGKWFSDAFQAVIDWWNNTLLPAIQALGQWFSDAFTNIGNFARDFVGMLVDAWGHVVDWWNSTMVPFLQALAAPFVAAFDWIKRLVWNAMTIIMFLWLKLVDLWNGVLLPAIQAVGQWFSDVFTGLWNNVLKPVVDGIVQGFQALVDFFTTVFAWVYDNVIKPYIDLWVSAFRAVVDWWNMTFIPAMQAFGNWIGSIMTWIYDTIIKPVIDLIVNGFGMLVDFWNLHLIPALQAVGDFIGSIMDWIYNTLIKPVVDNVVATFQTLVDWWNNTLMPAAQAVGDWFSITIGGAINGVRDFINDAVKNFQTFITFVNDKLKPIIDGIKGAFDAVADAIGKVLGKIGEFANNPLGGIQDWLGIAKDGNGQGVMPTPGNSGGGVYKGNGVQFAGGGVLGGYAPGRDVIPALLSPGESVLVPELTRAIGPDNIMAANAAASGGRPAGSGPSLTSGYSAAAGRGGGTTIVSEGAVQIVVQAGPQGVSGADIEAIRAAVNEIFEDQRRRGY